MSLTEEQKAERLTGIGGSDAPVVMGVDKYKDLWTLYLEKTGELPDGFVGNQFTEWGTILEPAIAAKYVEQTGNKIRVDNKTHRAKHHPHMLAHIDRRVVGGKDRRALEVKTASRPDEWGESGSTLVPAPYYCQVQHYIHVLALDVVDVAVLIGGNDYRQYEIERHDVFIDRLIEAEGDFWDRVEARVSPDPVFEHRRMVETMQTLYPGTNGSIVRLPEVAQKYFDVWNDSREQRLTYSKVEDGCKNRISMLMGEASVGLLPDGSCYTRKAVDRKAYEVSETSYVDFRHTKKLPKAVVEWLENEPEALENADEREPTREAIEPA